MGTEPIFEHELSFEPEQSAEILRKIPATSGVLALFGHAATDRPYLMHGANLRRRLQHLLLPAEGQTKRLNLRSRIARIAWHETSSQLHSLLLLHRAMTLAFGEEETRKRMHLSPPFTLRYAVENRFPRIYVTNHLRRRSLQTTFGPFASRQAAERYREAVEEMFSIRRCFLELHPSPEDPGCIYGEMKKCMAPCQKRCTPEEYAAEALRVLDFLRTAGASLVEEFEGARDAASAEMLFEEAAVAHEQVTKAKAVASLADPLVQPLETLRATLLLPCPEDSIKGEPNVQVFVFAEGRLRGPKTVSLLGVRLAKEQEEVGTSLFAQPLMLAPIPLVKDLHGKREAGQQAGKARSLGETEQVAGLNTGVEPDTEAEPGRLKTADRQFGEVLSDTPKLRETAESAYSSAVIPPEERLLLAIALLEELPGAENVATTGDHLAILRRWYYRPEKQRQGVLFQRDKGAWPVRKMLRAAAKMALPAEKTAASAE